MIRIVEHFAECRRHSPGRLVAVDHPRREFAGHLPDGFGTGALYARIDEPGRTQRRPARASADSLWGVARIVTRILIALGFVAALILVTRAQMRARCEVCIEYRGRQVCEESVASNREEALMHATNAACAQLSGGVTDGIQCNNTPPVSSRCTE